MGCADPPSKGSVHPISVLELKKAKWMGSLSRTVQNNTQSLEAHRNPTNQKKKQQSNQVR